MSEQHTRGDLTDRIAEVLAKTNVRLSNGVGGYLARGTIVEMVNDIAGELRKAPGPQNGASIDHPNLRQIDRQLSHYRHQCEKAHAILDSLGVPKGPEVWPLTVLERLKALADRIGPSTADPDRPKSLFTAGVEIEPTETSTLGLDEGTVGVVRGKRFCSRCGRWHYDVDFGEFGAVMQEPNMRHARTESTDLSDEAADERPPTDDAERRKPENGRIPDEFDIRVAACERLYERLTDGPVPNPAELARVIDILR